MSVLGGADDLKHDLSHFRTFLEVVSGVYSGVRSGIEKNAFAPQPPKTCGNGLNHVLNH